MSTHHGSPKHHASDVVVNQPHPGSLSSYVQPFMTAFLRLHELGELIEGQEFPVSVGDDVDEAEALVALADAIAGRVGGIAASVVAVERDRAEEAMRTLVYAVLQVSGTRAALLSREIDAIYRASNAGS